MSSVNPSLRNRVRQALDQLRQELLDERVAGGHWEGELSPSALSTATAVSAMAAVTGHSNRADDVDHLKDLIRRGIDYLQAQQNDDGGFGDTDRSHSNVATSYLVLGATTLAHSTTGDSLTADQVDRLQSYIDSVGGIDALRERYGKDKTFVVPIMTNLAIAGLVSWDDVAALPFEAAVFPQSMYRLLRMPVVSYAIPALVAIGQARHFHGRKSILPLRMVRHALLNRAMHVLRRMQPASGGYLEATPLTSFVVMSLAATGRGDHPVAQDGLRFLSASMNEDGGWPIDTNLATWVTSLAIHALSCDPEDDGTWCVDSLVDWHLSCQHKQRHPYTGAEPGGWGWSDLSGAVPDSDDTPAAVIALHAVQRWVDAERGRECAAAMDEGIGWLRKLQNRDGGWPTFCRGWGKLPFDRSSNDLTAHALRAMGAGRGTAPITSADQARQRRAAAFLRNGQQSDGSWLPLWFGNQDRVDESNPVYGTSRVLVASATGAVDRQMEQRGRKFLRGSQNPDGGWGGGPSVTAWNDGQLGLDTGMSSSIEETALAVDALASVWIGRRDLSQSAGVDLTRRDAKNVTQNAAGGLIDASARNIDASAGNEGDWQAIIRGVEFLLKSVDDGRHRVPWPIGFYFAKLWYYERLYPLIFSVTALGQFLRATAEGRPDCPR